MIVDKFNELKFELYVENKEKEDDSKNKLEMFVKEIAQRSACSGYFHEEENYSFDNWIPTNHDLEIIHNDLKEYMNSTLELCGEGEEYFDVKEDYDKFKLKTLKEKIDFSIGYMLWTKSCTPFECFSEELRKLFKRASKYEYIKIPLYDYLKQTNQLPE